MFCDQHGRPICPLCKSIMLLSKERNRLGRIRDIKFVCPSPRCEGVTDLFMPPVSPVDRGSEGMPA